MTVRIIHGDCREVLASLPDESVHCAVTSPPYWRLRDYRADGQIGLEPSLGEHLAGLVALFRDVRRVLRRDGTLWLNYGDMYAGSWGAQAKRESPGGHFGNSIANHPKTASRTGAIRDAGLKPKDLCMAANRLAILLQDDGWWVRSEIVWHKPSPMPESVTDRPTVAHEKVWLLTRSPQYFYDAEAVREPVTGNAHPRRLDGQTLPAKGEIGTFNRRIGTFVRKSDKQRGHGRRHEGFNDRWDSMSKAEQQAGGRNLRSVWTVATAGFSGEHFATFPPDLVAPCIKAGCPEGGVVLDPFAGAGTVGLVADRLGRSSILIEVNGDYCEMARRRIAEDVPLIATPPHLSSGEISGLFDD